MYKPFLDNTDKSRELITTFGGYNHNLVIDDNDFYDEMNLSSDNYPALTPRNKRAFFTSVVGDISGIYSKTKLCYIRDGYLYYGGEKVNSCYFGNLQRERTFVSMGAKLVVFPDMVYINTNDFSDYGTLDAEYTCQSVDAYMCRGDGVTINDYAVGSAPPEDAVNGDLWLDTSGEKHILKQYSESLDAWNDAVATYVALESAGIGAEFKIGDGITLSGFDEIGIGGAYIIKDCGNDYITVSGTVECACLLEGEFTVKREVPQMDFVCENNNRLWGCNSQKNEIYASKLGDPTNFNVFSGISTDSYAVSVGSDGDFTAAVSFRGYILFFKENCLHKIYGSNPPYTLTTSFIRGVQKGSHNSVKCLNETLYYKSPTGICAYEGGVPVDISAPLGNEYYTNGVGGTYKNKYYICLTDKLNNRTLFCFDESHALWHKEDNINICSFANNNCNLYFLEKTGDTYRLGIIDGENMYGNFTGELMGFTTEDTVNWYGETGLWGLHNPLNKYYGNITVRAYGEKGSDFSLSYQCNSKGDFIPVCSKKLGSTGSFNIPLSTPRSDHIRLRIQGTGKADIYSLLRKVERGSEEFV